MPTETRVKGPGRNWRGLLPAHSASARIEPCSGGLLATEKHLSFLKQGAEEAERAQPKLGLDQKMMGFRETRERGSCRMQHG